MEYKNSEMFDLIDEYIHHARDRRVMKDRLINGYGIEALAEKYEVSVSQMKRIVRRRQLSSRQEHDDWSVHQQGQQPLFP